MVSHIRPAKRETGRAPPPRSCVDAGKRVERAQAPGWPGKDCDAPAAVCRLSARPVGTCSHRAAHSLLLGALESVWRILLEPRMVLCGDKVAALPRRNG